ncbi:MAG: AAA family ATPase [Thiofilum sp.]|uniref:AAA family ATPase n=1 Tax=Thiofilum sp. TaxID=2212733 RepID=UPI0025D0862D|nr:AAA family ATPase [Thiofilum sp.]MBK8455223.1 ATP-binding protein [Thiofilum sp.]
MNQVAEKSDNQEPVRVVEIGVKGLFGLYDHTVKLKDERVTIIHGPNGVGKTVFLKLVHLFYSFKYENLLKFDFTSLVFFFSNGASVQIKKFFVEDKETNDYVFIFTDNSSEEWSISINGYLVDSKSGLLEKYYKKIINIFDDAKINKPKLIELSDLEFLSKGKVTNKNKITMFIAASYFAALEGYLIKCSFISILRVFSELLDDKSNSVTFRLKIGSYPQDLSDIIKTSLGSYGVFSDHLERTFAKRLIDADETIYDKSMIESLFQEINLIKKRYEKIGLLKDFVGFDDISNLNPTKYSSIGLYASDIKSKLNILEPLARKIELFVNITNSKIKNKKIIIDKELGFKVIDRNNKELNLVDLSSGEQHLIILIYELLFKVESNTLLLIDEPELSMHISWQREFVDDLLKIIELNPIDVILATHSPSIINDHSNLMVAFKADVQQEAA